MSRRTLKWTGILGPGLIAGLFETFRHDYLDSWLSPTYGNLSTTLLVIIASALLLGQVFRLMERSDQALRLAETRNSVLRERERIARDLHDGVSQSIFYLNVKVNELEKGLDSRGLSAQQEAELAEMRSVLSGLYDNVRQTIFELNATQGLGEEDFTQAIRNYLSDFAERFNLDVHVHSLEHTCTPSCPKGELELFRILQEALLNVWRHAGVTAADVWLEDAPGTAILTVSDKGRGFDPTQVPGPKDGNFGFTSMRERAERLGATLEIISEPGKGTTIRLVPLGAEVDAS